MSHQRYQSALPSLHNPALLETALTHRSALNEPKASGTPSLESNERLEFLGDAVLELIVTRQLFEQFPKEDEGKLTAFRSALVRTETLAELALEIGLGEKLYLSHGEEASGGRTNPSLLADTLEALLGALYLDQGLEVVEQFLLTHLLPRLASIQEKGLYKDAKSNLQEVVQARGLSAPEYLLLKAEGPDHAKQFRVAVRVAGKIVGEGVGTSKQLAQQQAATKALALFEKKTDLV